MITQSPESRMREPYQTYVRQRSEAIARTLAPITGDTNVQLCPRAITPTERLFKADNAIVYGAVVSDEHLGHKSILYEPNTRSRGIETRSFDEAAVYAQIEFERGNRVRVKESSQCAGLGQYIVVTIEELRVLFNDVTIDNEHGFVLMPHLDIVTERISVGMVALKQAGSYYYAGREQTTQLEGNEIYGGTDIGLCSAMREDGLVDIARNLQIPSSMLTLGLDALRRYCTRTLEAGRVSIDILEGITDSGEMLQEVVDVTPRVGGTTPAEVLAIAAITSSPQSISFAGTRLLYNPKSVPKTGTNFVDTESLVINAKVEAVVS